MDWEVELDGETVRFASDDTILSAWVAKSILEGRTYPDLPFVEDVEVVVDAGANCGAATVYLARHHPDAAVHAFEPASRPRAFLERNVESLPNVTVHPFGLHSEDARLPLYRGKDDSITGSLIRREVNLDEAEEVEVRHAGRWAAAAGLDRIDVMKVDVEGLEVEVLESLAHLLPTVKVLYVEYDSRQARRRIDHLLAPTHELYFGLLHMLDQGESIYLRSDLCDLSEATAHLWTLFEGLGAGDAPTG